MTSVDAGGCCCYATIPHSSVGIVERWGKFSKLAPPGWNWILCCFGESVRGSVSLRVTQTTVDIESKTRDNVFVGITVVVQYQILPDSVYEAFYRLSKPKEQIKAYVFDG